MLAQTIRKLSSSSSLKSFLPAHTTRSYHHSTRITLPPTVNQTPSRDASSAVPLPPNKSSHNSYPHIASDASPAPTPTSRQSISPHPKSVKNATSKSIQDLGELDTRELRNLAGAKSSDPPSPPKPTDFVKGATEGLTSKSEKVKAKGTTVEEFAQPAERAGTRTTSERLCAAKEAMPEGGVKPVNPLK